jgi:hypothetical protein
MELKEQGKGWCLAFRDASVHLIQIDFSLSLFFLDPPNEVTVIIETPCRLKTRDTSVVLRPGEPSTLAPILPFFQRRGNWCLDSKHGSTENGIQWWTHTRSRSRSKV